MDLLYFMGDYFLSFVQDFKWQWLYGLCYIRVYTFESTSSSQLPGNSPFEEKSHFNDHDI